MSTPKPIETLVLDYCLAAANLYSCISVKKLLHIYNSQNAPLSDGDFCSILEKLSVEYRPFALFSTEEILTGKSKDTPTIEKELLAEHLYCLGDFDDYNELKELSYGLPYRVLERDKFLRYADDAYVEKTPEYISLRAYFRNIPSLSKEDADELALEAVDMLRVFNGDIGYVLGRVTDLNLIPSNSNEWDILEDLCYSLSRNVRLPSLKGATLNEILEKGLF